jgi:hypothetical protein
MSVRELARRRKLLGNAASLLFILVVLGLIDGLAAEMRGEFGRLDALPGQTLLINGPLPPAAQELGDIVVVTDAPAGDLKLTPNETYSGFWYGGGMWKGELAVSPAAKPGRYPLIVRGPGPEPINPALAFTVAVYPDQAALRRASPSVSMSLLGHSPFFLAAIITPFALALAGAGYAVSLRLSRLRARMGITEIYMCKNDPQGTLIGFDAPAGFSAPAGSEVTLLDETGREAGRAVVTQSEAKGIVALAPSALGVNHGFCVKL